MHKQILSLVLTALFVLSCLTGCATQGPTTETAVEGAELYYQSARKAQRDGDYAKAIELLSELGIRFPASPYSQLAPLEIAYARYKTEKYALAIQSTDLFLEQQPNHSSRDYAFYLKGLAYTKLAEAGGPEKTTSIRRAFEQFSQIIQRYPTSQYRGEALKHTSELRNQLAQEELATIKQLLQEGDKKAALERTRYLKENYPDTPAASQVFDLLGNSYSISIGKPVENTLHDETWLLQQTPDHFTIQLAGTSRLSGLKAFVEKYRLENDVSYYRRNDMGGEWFPLLYGNYSNRDEADKAAQELKSRLPVKDPWVRQFRGIQEAIRAFNDKKPERQ